jgi:hypothetical protein
LEWCGAREAHTPFIGDSRREELESLRGRVDCRKSILLDACPSFASHPALCYHFGLWNVALEGKWVNLVMLLLSLRLAPVALLLSLGFAWLAQPAMADVLVVGNSDNLDVRASGATAKDLFARLAEVLGVPIKYEGFGDETIDGSYRGSVFHVLSQYFPKYIIVVRTNAARVTGVTISKAGDGGQVVTAEAPMPQEYRQMTQTLVPLPLFNN